ncbi:hypothetical protein B7463_g9819, partial [Scytalidium lignicola]
MIFSNVSLWLLGLSSCLFESAYAFGSSPFGTLNAVQKGGILNVVINNNSTNINLYDAKVQSDLYDLVTILQGNTTVKVVVFTSANPDFFIAHLDLITRTSPSFATDDPRNPAQATRLFFNMTELKQVTIAAIDGRTRGVGNEFILSCDMRFATKDKTLLGQPEVGVGLIPGAGGTQYLPRFIGRGLAMEYILSSKDIGAEDAERIGWINKAFDTRQDMMGYVDDLTARISLFEQDVIGLGKQAINNASSRPTLQALETESEGFLGTITLPETQQLLGKLIVASHNETRRQVELYLGESIPNFYK